MRLPLMLCEQENNSNLHASYPPMFQLKATELLALTATFQLLSRWS